MQFPFETAVLNVTYDSASGLMYIIGAADDDDAPWIEQFLINHRCKDSANRIKYQIYLDIFEMQPIFG